MKKTAKPSKKRLRTIKKKKKPGNDLLKSFILVGVLVILSLCISFLIILFHSDTKKTDGSFVETPHSPDEEQNISPPFGSGTEGSFPAAETTKPAVSQPPRQDQTNAGRTTTETQPEQKPPENLDKGTLVFVIDDAGNNLRELEPFLRIPFPLTIAVLPGLPYSAEAAKRIRDAGKEVILHQPMEALGGQNPGPGAIYSNMSADEVTAVLKRNVAEVGPVAGINNHQGSKITEDRAMMEIILNFCAENGLFFLDSRTTAQTVVPVTARRLGLKIAERDVFIDNEQDKASMSRSITGGLARTERNSIAVMIGHTWSPELAPLLAEQFPVLTKQGYTIKTASDIIGIK
ncbi:MAG: divergent polysaccharide deacetylase family protein [Treponema sp.]|jgi:polysaccharide deacetylase 2 family uncharacterized protein YibQ|nr:divergent polysaccharide deacetylase family protein [Treponema sp.]